MLKAEIERLRKQGSQQLAEEQEKIRQELANERKQTGSSAIVPGRLKVSWKIIPDNEDSYPYDKLYSILQKYGNINALIISSKKRGSAIVEFANKRDADLAYSVEKGLHSCPLTLSWIQGDTSSKAEPMRQPAATTAPQPTVKATSMADFEAQVLKSMREAQERKRKLESANGST